MYINGYAQPKYEQETEMYKSKKQLHIHTKTIYVLIFKQFYKINLCAY